MQSVFLESTDEEKVIFSFNNARNDEYRELIEKCEDFFREIDKEISRRNYTFAEVEENEEELEKLYSWHKKVKSRDSFSASLGRDAGEKLNACKTLLEDFNDKVYEYNHVHEKRKAD